MEAGDQGNYDLEDLSHVFIKEKDLLPCASNEVAMAAYQLLHAFRLANL